MEAMVTTTARCREFRKDLPISAAAKAFSILQNKAAPKESLPMVISFDSFVILIIIQRNGEMETNDMMIKIICLNK
jgi:hypothetical protein